MSIVKLIILNIPLYFLLAFIIFKNIDTFMDCWKQTFKG